MLTAGVPESTILLKIETAAARGLVDLDASSSALAHALGIPLEVVSLRADLISNFNVG
jgi:hypothetical protein